MLVSPDIHKACALKGTYESDLKGRKSVTQSEKNKYQEQMNQVVDQYNLEYATYLESLLEDSR